MLRKAVEGNEDTLTREQATDIMKECMKVLFYRDARSLNKVRPSIFLTLAPIFVHPTNPLADTFHSYDATQFQIATVTEAGVEISESLKSETQWAFAEGLRGYGNSSETI